MTEDLFRSPDLLVRACTGIAIDCCFVTFDSFTDRRTLDRPGFGEAFFQSRGIDAIHVISRENDWYQYAEMERAMAAVRLATRGYGRVVTYGSSMGGYAAIRLAGLAGATCTLAMSPQYSIDQTIARFENRWQEFSDRFKAVWEARLPLPKLDEAYIIYDPHDLDGRHVALFRPAFAFTPVPLREAGHTVSGFLQEVGLLQSVVTAVCEGSFDVAATVAEAWRRREQSLQHFLARAEQSPDRPRRLALLAELVDRAPEHVAGLSRLAMELAHAKRYDEALAMHRRAVSFDPRDPTALTLYCMTLQHSGDLAGALAVMEDVASFSGGAAMYVERVEKIRQRLAKANARRRPAWRRWFDPRPAGLRP